MSKIGINQRIPLTVLEIGLKAYLEGSYNADYLKEQLSFEYSGKNRVVKAMSFVNKTILHNPLSSKILDNKLEILNALKLKGDRSVILIALLNSAFPFSFTVLNAFSKYFMAQECVSTELIKKDAINKYGSNRSTGNALFSVIPMFLEAGFFSRVKPGLYHLKEKISPHTLIAKELYLHSFLINIPLLENSDILILEPYFNLVES